MIETSSDVNQYALALPEILKYVSFLFSQKLLKGKLTFFVNKISKTLNQGVESTGSLSPPLTVPKHKQNGFEKGTAPFG